MIDALSYEYDLLTDVSWPRLLVVAFSLAMAYRIERRAWRRMLTTAFLISQIAEAVVMGLAFRSWELVIWWSIFGAIPYVAVRPELVRLLLDAPRRASWLLPRLVAFIQARRAPTQGALKNREALKLLRQEGWRPGWSKQTIADASGREHSVWVPPQRLPLGMRLHGWHAFASTAAIAAFVIWAIYEMPPWARPIAEVGVGIGILGHLGFLPNPLRWFGL